MRSYLALLIAFTLACAQKPASLELTLEQQQTLALAVPAGESELARAAKAAREAPGLADRWVTLGQLWVRHGRTSTDPGAYLSAEAAAAMALSLQPEFSAALALKAVVALNQHRFSQARELARQSLRQRDDDLLAMAALADAEVELGALEDAAKTVQQMLDLKPNLPSYGRAAHLRWLTGDAAGAISLYRQAIDAGRNPKDPEPQAWMAVQLAMVSLEQNDLEGAAAGFDFALSNVKRYAPALVGTARVLLARDQPVQAQAALEEAVAVSPLVDTWVLLAQTRQLVGDTAGSQAAWAQAERLGRASDPLALARGWAEAGMHAEDAVRLLQAEQRLRANSSVEGALAWALFKAGHLDLAKTASARALASGLTDARLRYQHAAIRAALGERREALTELQALQTRVLPPPLRQEAQALLTALHQQLASR
jgi:tetratricopeptide (TPR) repeat protein